MQTNLDWGKPRTAMDEFGGSGGCPRGEVLALHEADAEPAGCGIERDAAPGGPAADDEHVEGIRGGGPGQRRPLRGAWRRGRARLGHAPRAASRAAGTGRKRTRTARPRPRRRRRRTRRWRRPRGGGATWPWRRADACASLPLLCSARALGVGRSRVSQLTRAAERVEKAASDFFSFSFLEILKNCYGVLYKRIGEEFRRRK